MRCVRLLPRALDDAGLGRSSVMSSSTLILMNSDTKNGVITMSTPRQCIARLLAVLTPNVRRILVLANPEVRGVPEEPVVGPFNKRELHDELRLYPRHHRHVLGADSLVPAT